MKLSRRDLLISTAALAGAGAVPEATSGASKPASSPGARALRTLNGQSLAWKMVDGAKEFHLRAGAIEHEFAPGSRAKCWGYNGTTPGPTLEAVEGDRVRVLVTNELPEPTSVHWHGILLPNGMDGVSGLNQAEIAPGETWAYEFTLRQHGTHMYHPHADEMTQMAFGMMGMFIVHPRVPTQPRVDRDFAFLLHNWALRPGTYRPDPSIMTDFNLWTFNSRVYPGIDPLVVGLGERVRLRIGNLSMYNHPIHLHGHRFWVTGSDGGRWPQALWRPEVTEIIGVGQTRDLEFIADNPGDWSLHCHMAHHTMNAMGHGIANPVGVDQSGIEARLRAQLPGYTAMGSAGMYEHEQHAAMGHMPGPENTLPMLTGQGPFGPLGMGGMFTVVKIRDRLHGSADPGWYDRKDVPRAHRVAVSAGAGAALRPSESAASAPRGSGR